MAGLRTPFSNGLELLIAFFVLIIIGVIIIMIVGALIFFLPAVIIGAVVWWLTGSEFWGAIAFLAIAVLSLVRKR